MTTWETDAGEQVTTIAVEQPDGRFLAYIAHSPDIRATSESAFQAEQNAINAYERRARKNSAPALSIEQAEEIEDERNVEAFLRREAAGDVEWTDLEEIKREYGWKKK